MNTTFAVVPDVTPAHVGMGLWLVLPREGLRGSGMIDSIIEASDAESFMTRF